MVLRNVGTLPHDYASSQPRRLLPESSPPVKTLCIRLISGVDMERAVLEAGDKRRQRSKVRGTQKKNGICSSLGPPTG
jgi:hypothetical protein